MNIEFFFPRWGSTLSIEAFMSQVAYEGYTGVEMTIPVSKEEKIELATLLKKYKLKLIAQQGESFIADEPVENLSLFELYIRNAAELNPIFINSQTGKDYFTFDQNCTLLEKAFELEKELKIPIVHELHRGKFSFSPITTMPYIEKFTSLRLCIDLSHWVNVSESYLQSEIQTTMVNRAIKHGHHIHARIGFDEGPQVNDPRAPEWNDVVNFHLAWWDKVIIQAKKRGLKTFTITPEFGPSPYMPVLPYTQQPLSSQNQVNHYMKDLLKKRYQDYFV